MGTGDDIPMTINEATHPAALLARILELEAESAIYIIEMRNLRSRIRELEVALLGVIRVADRNTVEFDAARALPSSADRGGEP